MAQLRVWAPRRDRVDAVVDGLPHAMGREAGGWWSCQVDDMTAESRYGFSLDGGPPRPDPRSGSQPDGPEGLSAAVDHGAFAWTDDDWRGLPLPGAILYELHVGTFTADGTFEAVIAKLPHLLALGVDAIEVLPVAEFPGDRGWGYDGVDLYAPHHAYGGPEGLKRLVDACHAHGLGVVLDVVYNHLGPSGNYLAEFGPYFSERHRTEWGAAVNYDGPGSDEVRRYVIDNAVGWLQDFHIDGLRLDAVHAIVDHSALHVLEQMAAEVDALGARLGRPVFLVAESDLNDPRVVRSRQAGGFGVASAWADDWHHALHAALTGERQGYYEDFGSIGLLGKALRQAWVHDGSWSSFRQRHFGRSPAGLAGDAFVIFTQNHDQVGNRAAGERLSALVSDGRLRVAAALLLTAPFTPLLFQGEEWGAATPFQYFTDHRDPELATAVSEGRRQEFSRFGWDPGSVPDPQSPATFARSKLDWGEPDAEPHAALLAWYRDLIRLRRLAGLGDPRLDTVSVEVDEEHGVLELHRGDLGVFVNLGDASHCFTAAMAPLLARSHPGVLLRAEGLVVPPDAVGITGR